MKDPAPVDSENARNQQGDAAALFIRNVLLEAIAEYRDIYPVTHVPPFKETSLDRARMICGAEKLRFNSCKAIREVPLEIMSDPYRDSPF